MAFNNDNKMGDTKTTLWQEITQGLPKLMIWLGYIGIGIIGKLAFESRANRLTKRQIIVKTSLSIFAGVLAAIVCENLGYEKWGKIIVPVVTLIGEGLVVYIMTNWRKIAAKLFTGWFDKKQ